MTMWRPWTKTIRHVLQITKRSCYISITLVMILVWIILCSVYLQDTVPIIMISAKEHNYTIYHKTDPVDIAEMPKMLERKDVRGGNYCTQNKPDIVMIGVSKCGTGSVRTFLNEHPDIAMEMNSEGVQYFNLRYMRQRLWYLSQMPCSQPGQLTAENSPQYFTSEEAPNRMYRFNPDMKLIVTVRHPIKRLESEFVQMAVGRPQFLFGETVEENVIDPLRGEINDKKTLVSKSVYIKYLNLWLKYFSVKQIHIVDGDEFAKNPVKELNEIERFLGVKNYFKKMDFAYVESRGFFCLKRKTNRVECLEKGKGRPHPYIDPYVIQKLKEFYAPFNEELFTTFGKRFDWN